MGLLNQRLGIEETNDNSSKKNISKGSLYSVSDTDIVAKKNESINDFDGISDNTDIINNSKKREKTKEIPQPIEIGKSVAELSTEEFDINSILEARNEAKREKRYKIRTKIINVILISFCVYLIFLIYGVFCTNYQYNEKGKIEPVILSVSEIKELKEFNKILAQYEENRVLYEKILRLDYRLSLGVEDPLVLAPEYEKLLDEVNNLTVKTNALDVDTKYETIKVMLLNWVQTDTAVYLQKISSGISNNNADDASVAIEYKSIMYDDFSLITQNIISIGENVEGSNITNIKQWSPEKFINEDVIGKKAEE